MFDFFSNINISETSKLKTHDNPNFLFIQLNAGSKCDFCLFIFDKQTIGISNSSNDSIKYYKLKNPIDIDSFKESYLK